MQRSSVSEGLNAACSAVQLSRYDGVLHTGVSEPHSVGFQRGDVVVAQDRVSVSRRQATAGIDNEQVKLVCRDEEHVPIFLCVDHLIHPADANRTGETRSQYIEKISWSAELLKIG